MAGLITVITGEMFSGKSSELASIVQSSLADGHQVDVFYPSFAQRPSDRDIAHRITGAHSGLRISSVPDGDPLWIQEHMRAEASVVVVDEAQFFSAAIVDVVRVWRRAGKLVFIGGLDQDFQGNPFGPMGDLLCIANQVVKLHAICAVCQTQDAFVSYRLSRAKDLRLIGDSEYIPVCEDCYDAFCADESRVLVQNLND